MPKQTQVEVPKQRPAPPEEPIDELPEVTVNQASLNAAMFLLKLEGYHGTV